MGKVEKKEIYHIESYDSLEFSFRNPITREQVVEYLSCYFRPLNCIGFDIRDSFCK